MDRLKYVQLREFASQGIKCRESNQSIKIQKGFLKKRTVIHAESSLSRGGGSGGSAESYSRY